MHSRSCHVKRLTSDKVNKARSQLPQGELLRELGTANHNKMEKEINSNLLMREGSAGTFLQNFLDHGVNTKPGKSM
jgi:hypothetical protein